MYLFCFYIKSLTFFSVSLSEKIPCLKIVLEVQTKAEAKCAGYGTNTLHLLAGNGNSIACPGTKCYSHIDKVDVRWYKVRVSPLSIQKCSGSMEFRIVSFQIIVVTENKNWLFTKLTLL